MKHKFLLGICLSCFLFACTSVPIEEYQVIPKPQSVTYLNGFLSWGGKITLAYVPELAEEATLLKDNLYKDMGLEVELLPDASDGVDFGDVDIKMVLSPDLSLKITTADSLNRIMEERENTNADTYVINITPQGVTVRANTETGAFNAIQTLRQIIKKRNGRFMIQKGSISDFPAFSWRAFMLDEGRYFKGKEVVKQLLDEMSLLKMNVFHWHQTDDQGWRIEIKKYPKLTEIGSCRDSTQIGGWNSTKYDGKPHCGFYTQEEIKEIVAYAAERHIQVVPEIEMPGHATAAIASYPWLGTSGKQVKVACYFGVQYDVFNVTDPKVLQFFEDVIDEVIALFPSPVFHIGGDEVRYNQWSASPRIKAYMKEKGINTPAELQVYFTNNISNILDSKNKRMMGWNEITGARLHEYQSEEDTDVNRKLSDKTIVHFWKGDSALIVNTVKKGYDIVNSDNAYTYLDYNYQSIPLSRAYSFNPIPAGLPKELESKVLGLGCQIWGEWTPTVERMNELVYPRLAAFAECGWTFPENKNFERFEKALPYFLDRWTNKGIVYGGSEK